MEYLRTASACPWRTNRSCIVARVVFLSDGAKAMEEVHDTELAFSDCSGKHTPDETAEWLSGLKIVEPSYNRSVGQR